MFLDNIIAQLAENSCNPILFKPALLFLNITGVILLFLVAFKFCEHLFKRKKVETQKKHFFSTFGMLFFVYILFQLWTCSIGQLNIQDEIVQYIYFITGALLMIFAVCWHLKSKIDIGFFWSDGIEIKENHYIVQKGAYSLARHPMYASLLMWAIGASLLTFNYLSLLLVFVVFFPLMIIRARAEEKELLTINSDYILYKENTKMLCPTLKGIPNVIVRLCVLSIFSYFIIKGINVPELVFLYCAHLYLGYSLVPDKLAFSYRSKSTSEFGRLIFTNLAVIIPAIIPIRVKKKYNSITIEYYQYQLE